MAIIINKQPYEVTFSGCPVIFSFAIAPYGIPERRQDIRLQLTIEKEQVLFAENYSVIKTQLIAPDINGQISIDISTICDAHLNYFIPKLNLRRPVFCAGQSGRFRVKIQGLVNNLPITEIVSSDVFTLLKGGIAKQEYHYKNFITQNILVDKQPLHHYAAKEIVYLDETKYLFWTYPYNDNKNQRVIFTVYKADNTTVQQECELGSDGFQWGVYCSPAGYRQLIGMMPTDPYTDDYVKYSIGILDEDDRVIVEEQMFYFDYRKFYNPTNLIYRNSLGGVCNQIINGEIEFSAEYQAQIAKQVPPPGYMTNNVMVHEDIDSVVEETQTFTGYTQFLAKDRIDRLRDLFLSRLVYEHRGQKLIPINIVRKTTKFFTNRSNLNGIQIQWKDAFTNQFYTPAGSIEGDNACPALDSFEVVQINRNTLQIIWSMPLPYDILKITVDNGVDDPEDSFLFGNSGSETIIFTNPAEPGDSANITITGKVVCDIFADPMQLGPGTDVNLEVFGNLNPIAVDDTFSIEAGYDDYVELSGNVLTNDYDPDGDEIECVVVAAGDTDEGGHFNLGADGRFEYKPPNANFNGIDQCEYTIRETANHSAADTGTIFINVGDITLGDKVYIRLVEKNRQTQTQTNASYVTAEIWAQFFYDPMCTIPRYFAPTPPFLVFNYEREIFNATGPLPSTPLVSSSTNGYTALAIGKEHMVYSGMIYKSAWIPQIPLFRATKFVFTIQPGSGYIPV